MKVEPLESRPRARVMVDISMAMIVPVLVFMFEVRNCVLLQIM